MQKIIIAGSGKIGTLIGLLLANTNDYQVLMLDKAFKKMHRTRLEKVKQLSCHEIDITDQKSFSAFLNKEKAHAIVSCLPYYCNLTLVEQALKHHLHYFDLTEDTAVAQKIQLLSAENPNIVLMPRCGLAPGFIGLIAKALSESFDELHEVKLRVGALPINSNNALQYALTWSTDGLINEYANDSEIVYAGETKWVPSLEGLETIKIDGITYEAFHTSGGLGNLADILRTKTKGLNYKTIRYPGHCEKMRFLMDGLHLRDHREILKNILEDAIPKTYQDVVIVYVSVTGMENGHFIEKNYLNKIYPKKLFQYDWSAMQFTTASSVAAVIDIICTDKNAPKGYLCQENLNIDTFLNNRFGIAYQSNQVYLTEKPPITPNQHCTETTALSQVCE